MDKTTLIILSVAIAAIVLMSIFPPWYAWESGGSKKFTIDRGYSPIWNPPEPGEDRWGSSGLIDYGRLLLQCILVVFSAGSIIAMRYFRKRFKPTISFGKPVPCDPPPRPGGHSPLPR